jgi:hypothetical protein
VNCCRLASHFLQLTIVLVLSAVVPAIAAESGALKLSGSVRVRQEVLNGQYRPGLDARDDMLALRSTLLAEWDTGVWRVGGELFDSRAYDTGVGGVLSANEVNALELVQVYVAGDFSEPFGKGSAASLQAGRFVMNLGSRRLVASDEFRNTPQAYTGLRADMRLANKAQFTLFYTLPQQRRPDNFAALKDNRIAFDHEGFDLQLWGALASKAGLPGGMTGDASYIRLQEDDSGARATRNRDLHSFSARLIRDAAPKTTDFEIEGIYQTGHVRSSAAVAASRRDVDAWFLHAEIGHTGDQPWKPHVSLEFDHASGDGPGADNERFDSLFGMRRADLAPSGIYGALGRTNLQAVGLRLETTPSARLDVFGAWRVLWAADRHDSFSTSGIRDASGAAGKFAGQQLDTRLRYWFVPKKLRTEINAVWLMRGDLLRDAPNASPHGNTTFVAVSVTYSF